MLAPAKPARNTARVPPTWYRRIPYSATRADVIVMLGVLERVKDIESLFTHLRFCKRDIPPQLLSDGSRQKR
jgi:hypothetical protein